MRLQIARAGPRWDRRSNPQDYWARRFGGCRGRFLCNLHRHVLAADLGSGYSTAIAVPTASRTGRPPNNTLLTHYPRDTKPELSAQRARIVDQLYEEIMRRSSPGCASATSMPSMAGAC